MTDLFLVVGLGVVIYMVTQAIKTITDISMTKERRKGNVWLTRVVFPGIPVVTGALICAFIPLRPTFLIDFVTEYITGFAATTVYAAYGAIIGQFSKSFYMEAKRFITELKLRKP